MSFFRKDTGGRLDSPKATASGDFWKPSSDMASCSVCHVPSPTSAVWIALPEQLLLWNQSFLKHPFFSGNTLTHLLWLCSQDRFFFLKNHTLRPLFWGLEWKSSFTNWRLTQKGIVLGVWWARNHRTGTVSSVIPREGALCIGPVFSSLEYATVVLPLG